MLTETNPSPESTSQCTNEKNCEIFMFSATNFYCFMLKEQLSVYVYRSKLLLFTEEESETCELQFFNQGVEHFKTLKIRFNFIEKKITVSRDYFSTGTYQNIKTCIFLSLFPLRTPFPSSLSVHEAFPVPIF
jgi:hypothetical protein